LTTATCWTMLMTTWCDDVKRSILALFLLGASICSVVLPRVDLPETAFNEADAPINLAPPVRPSIQVVPPAVDPISVLPPLALHCARRVVSGLMFESATVPRQRHQHSFQDLLCTFLI
jgi:hypothetical protein